MRLEDNFQMDISIWSVYLVRSSYYHKPSSIIQSASTQSNAVPNKN